MFLQSIVLLPLLATLAGAATDVGFNYDPNDSHGPDYWADLVLETENACGGDLNSPIALETSGCAMFADYQFKSGTCTFDDLDYTINPNGEQANEPAPETCDAATVEIPRVDGVFELLQLHIHANSEHTMDGNRYGAELHMVHKLKDTNDTRYAVIGLFIQGSSFVDNEHFSNFLYHFDLHADEVATNCNLTKENHWWTEENRTSISDGSDMANVYDLIPDGSSFYNYDGGLTTPPCSEIVEWNVADKPLTISVAQYNDLASLTLNYVNPDTCEYASIASPSGSTSRPIQATNNRTIQRICPKSFMESSASGSSDTSSAFVPLAPWTLFAVAVAALVI